MNAKTIIIATAVGSCLCGTAATFETIENTAATPINQVTQANVESVVDACVATTNFNKIAECRDNGLISFDAVAEKIAGKPEFAMSLYYNACASKNASLQEKCFESNYKLFKAAEKPSATLKIATYNSFLNFPTVCTPANRKAVTKELISLGRPADAIRIALGFVPVSAFGVHPDKEYAGYSAFCAEVAETFASAWIAVEPTVYSNGRLVNIWDDGADIYVYYRRFNRSKCAPFASKISKYAEDGQLFGFMREDSQPGIAARKALLESKFATENMKVETAKIADKFAKNKSASEKLYSEIKDAKLKVELAIYLGDVDKIIDMLKIVSDKLDAKTVESVIAPLNAVDAGYRTADLRLALMNINKKYTIKLYEDRDTWEPILSKIRAMIDTL